MAMLFSLRRESSWKVYEATSGNPSCDNLDWLAVIKTSLAVNYIIAR